MSVFPRTRTAAGYIAGTVPGELARARAAILLARLDACDDILAAGAGDVPAGLHGLLRDLVLARQRPAPPALRHGCLRGLNVHPVQSSPDP